jgi:hypothetical protein
MDEADINTEDLGDAILQYLWKGSFIHRYSECTHEIVKILSGPLELDESSVYIRLLLSSLG